MLPAPFYLWETGQIQTPAVPPSTAKLFGYEYDGNVPVMAREVTRTLLSLPQSGGTVILEGLAITVESNAAGYWSHEVVPGKEYRITIGEAGIDIPIIAPSVDTDLRTLI